ncbi:hypothetical protein GHK68_07740 [Sinorhizobium meliloti]|nr:hypothetical protein [Sinorhizobium meliloti]
MEARTLRRRCLWQALSAPELASIAVDQSNDKKARRMPVLGGHDIPLNLISNGWFRRLLKKATLANHDDMLCTAARVKSSFRVEKRRWR